MQQFGEENIRKNFLTVIEILALLFSHLTYLRSYLLCFYATTGLISSRTRKIHMLYTSITSVRQHSVKLTFAGSQWTVSPLSFQFSGWDAQMHLCSAQLPFCSSKQIDFHPPLLPTISVCVCVCVCACACMRACIYIYIYTYFHLSSKPHLQLDFWIMHNKIFFYCFRFPILSMPLSFSVRDNTINLTIPVVS